MLLSKVIVRYSVMQVLNFFNLSKWGVSFYAGVLLYSEVYTILRRNMVLFVDISSSAEKT